MARGFYFLDIFSIILEMAVDCGGVVHTMLGYRGCTVQILFLCRLLHFKNELVSEQQWSLFFHEILPAWLGTWSKDIILMLYKLCGVTEVSCQIDI